MTTIRKSCWPLLILMGVLVVTAGTANAIVLVDLTADAANSSTANYGTDIENMLTDAFAYNPDNPLDPIPIGGAHSDGFHADEPDGTDAYLSFTFTDGPITLGTDESFTVDLYGRRNCCYDRQEDYSVELYSGGVTGTLVASLSGQSIIQDPDTLMHNRTVLGSLGDTFDSIRIVGHDTSPGTNKFTPVEIRTFIGDGKPLNPVLTIDRTTGSVKLVNDTVGDIGIIGYSLTSDSGAFDPSGWITVKDTYDVNGDQTVDATGAWTVLSAAGSVTDLSETSFLTETGVFTAGSPIDLGASWSAVPSKFEGVVANLLLTDGTVKKIGVAFSGDEVTFGDLDLSGTIDANDWLLYLANAPSDLTGLPAAQAYQKGDFTGDGVNNMKDMDLFINLYEAANGAGSFATMAASVPEPTTGCILVIGMLAVGFGAIRRRVSRHTIGLFALIVAVGFGSLWMAPQEATAAAVNWGGVFEIQSDADIDTSGTIVSAINGAPVGSADIVVTIGATDITFVSPDPPLLPSTNYGAGGTVTGNANLDEVFKSHDWQPGGAGTVGTFTLTDLTPGQAYQIQMVAAADTRGCCLNREQIMQDTADGSGNNSDPLARSSDITESGTRYANSVIGMFQADGTTQDLFVQGVQSDPALSAYVLSEIAEIPIITLNVGTASGQVSLENTSSAKSFTINGIEIDSPGGSLNPAGWNSFAAQNLDPVDDGADAGETWLEGGTSSANSLLEGFLLGSTTMDPGDEIAIGSAFDTGVNVEDVVFRFRTTDGKLWSGLVAYNTDQPSGVGDYNGDGAVDQGDLDLVLLNWGSETTPPGWDNELPTGPIGDSQLGLVRTNWGYTTPSAQAVPEPSSALVLLLSGLIASSFWSTRRRK